MSGTKSVVLVDAGGSNTGSVLYALQRLGASAHVSSDPAVIGSADRVVLPGVGTAPNGMARLNQAGLLDLMRSLTQPVLGICLGMQLLYEHSEEGPADGLGAVPGSVRQFPQVPGLRVPHMGWNRLEIVRDDPLLHGLPGDAYAYFVHSFAAPVSAASIATSLHGEQFTAVLRRGNFSGTQFHPERSGSVGARILHNFLELE